MAGDLEIWNEKNTENKKRRQQKNAAELTCFHVISNVKPGTGMYKLGYGSRAGSKIVGKVNPILRHGFFL